MYTLHSKSSDHRQSASCAPEYRSGVVKEIKERNPPEGSHANDKSHTSNEVTWVISSHQRVFQTRLGTVLGCNLSLLIEVQVGVRVDDTARCSCSAFIIISVTTLYCIAAGIYARSPLMLFALRLATSSSVSPFNFCLQYTTGQKTNLAPSVAVKQSRILHCRTQRDMPDNRNKFTTASKKTPPGKSKSVSHTDDESSGRTPTSGSGSEVTTTKTSSGKTSSTKSRSTSLTTRSTSATGSGSVTASDSTDKQKMDTVNPGDDSIAPKDPSLSVPPNEDNLNVTANEQGTSGQVDHKEGDGSGQQTLGPKLPETEKKDGTNQGTQVQTAQGEITSTLVTNQQNVVPPNAGAPQDQGNPAVGDKTNTAVVEDEPMDEDDPQRLHFSPEPLVNKRVTLDGQEWNEEQYGEGMVTTPPATDSVGPPSSTTPRTNPRVLAGNRRTTQPGDYAELDPNNLTGFQTVATNPDVGAHQRRLAHVVAKGDFEGIAQASDYASNQNESAILRWYHEPKMQQQASMLRAPIVYESHPAWEERAAPYNHVETQLTVHTLPPQTSELKYLTPGTVNTPPGDLQSSKRVRDKQLYFQTVSEPTKQIEQNLALVRHADHPVRFLKINENTRVAHTSLLVAQLDKDIGEGAWPEMDHKAVPEGQYPTELEHCLPQYEDSPVTAQLHLLAFDKDMERVAGVTQPLPETFSGSFRAWKDEAGNDIVDIIRPPLPTEGQFAITKECAILGPASVTIENVRATANRIAAIDARVSSGTARQSPPAQLEAHVAAKAMRPPLPQLRPTQEALQDLSNHYGRPMGPPVAIEQIYTTEMLEERKTMLLRQVSTHKFFGLDMEYEQVLRIPKKHTTEHEIGLHLIDQGIRQAKYVCNEYMEKRWNELKAKLVELPFRASRTKTLRTIMKMYVTAVLGVTPQCMLVEFDPMTFKDKTFLTTIQIAFPDGLAVLIHSTAFSMYRDSKSDSQLESMKMHPLLRTLLVDNMFVDPFVRGFIFDGANDTSAMVDMFGHKFAPHIVNLQPLVAEEYGLETYNITKEEPEQMPSLAKAAMHVLYFDVGMIKAGGKEKAPLQEAFGQTIQEYLMDVYQGRDPQPLMVPSHLLYGTSNPGEMRTSPTYVADPHNLGHWALLLYAALDAQLVCDMALVLMLTSVYAMQPQAHHRWSTMAQPSEFQRQVLDKDNRLHSEALKPGEPRSYCAKVRDFDRKYNQTEVGAHRQVNWVECLDKWSQKIAGDTVTRLVQYAAYSGSSLTVQQLHQAAAKTAYRTTKMVLQLINQTLYTSIQELVQTEGQAFAAGIPYQTMPSAWPAAHAVGQAVKYYVRALTTYDPLPPPRSVRFYSLEQPPIDRVITLASPYTVSDWPSYQAQVLMQGPLWKIGRASGRERV